MKSILLRGGRVIDPSRGVDEVTDVLIGWDQIAAVEDDIKPPDADTVVFNARGLIVAPGLADVHVHFREPGFESKETICTGSRAAAAGGYTCVVCEPNVNPPIDNTQRARDIAKRAALTSSVRLYQKACITLNREGEELADFEALKREPMVVAVSDDGDPVYASFVMEAAMARAGKAGILVSPHCEDTPRAVYLRAGHEKKQGFASRGDYRNEPGYIARDIVLAAKHNAAVHISHVSTAESLESIRNARAAETQVTCEVTPHHFCLDREACEEKSMAVQVNPPIRSRSDRQAVVQAVADGTVDVIASDHAPHTPEDKEAGANGVIGLETTVGLVSTFLVREELINWNRAVSLLSTNPCRIFALPGGSLCPGGIGDVTVIDPALEWTVDPEDFYSKSRNCPFAGWKLTGKPVLTIVRGVIAHIDPFAMDKVKGKLSP